MPALAIPIRTALASLVAGLSGFSAARVRLHKLDKVETVPLASVYFQDTGSTVAGRGRRERLQRMGVSLFVHDAGGDAEAVLSSLVEELEGAVELARLDGSFPGVDRAHLENVTVAHDPTGRGRVADAHCLFTFTFTETLTT